MEAIASRCKRKSNFLERFYMRYRTITFEAITILRRCLSEAPISPFQVSYL